MASVNIFNDTEIVRYLKEICLLLIWISSLVIAITTTARQIPAERENRTLLPLLAKPLTRTQLILGKFLGCWLACGLALLCFYVFFGALAASREHHLAAAELFSGRVLALGHARRGRSRSRCSARSSLPRRRPTPRSVSSSSRPFCALAGTSIRLR